MSRPTSDEIAAELCLLVFWSRGFNRILSLKVPFWRIVLKKSFLADGRIFLGPLMRFARGDVRDHIVSHKNNHGSSYRRCRALQR
jgi:hypothetical protein